MADPTDAQLNASAKTLLVLAIEAARAWLAGTARIQIDTSKPGEPTVTKTITFHKPQ